MEMGVGSRIFFDDPKISVCLRFPKACAVSQMEVYAINVGAKIISQFFFCISTIDIQCGK